MNAIGIEISGEFLDLAPNTALTLELISPIFSDDLGLGANSHSFAFTIPLTPKNRRLLQHRHMALAKHDGGTIDATFYLFGLPWKEATVIILKAGTAGFQIRLELDESVISRRLGTVSLRDLDYGGPRVIDTNTGLARAQAMADHAYDTSDGTYDYVFFAYENLQPGDAIPGSRGIYANKPFGASSYAINYAPGGSPDQDNIEWLTPFVFWKYAMAHAFEARGIRLDMGSDFFQDAELASLVVFNPVAIDELFPTFIVGAGTVGINHYAGTLYLQRHMPDVTAKLMLSGTMKLFCAYIKRTPAGYGIFFRKDVLTGTDKTDWTRKTIYGHEIDFDGTYTGFSFFSEQDGTDQWNLPPKAVNVDFEIAGTAPDETTLPAATAANVGQVWLAEFEDALFQCQLDEGTNPATYQWVFLTRNLFPVVVGEDPEEVISPVSTVYMPDPGPPKVQVTPNKIQVDMPLISYERATESDGNFAPRLLFYRGIEIGGPQGGVTDLGGDYNYSLMWHGEKGLYEIWWKDWVTFLLQARLINVSLHLAPADILQMKWDQRVSVAVADGVVDGFVRKLRIQIKPEGIQSVTGEIITG